MLHGAQLILNANEVVGSNAEIVINGVGDDGAAGPTGGKCDDCSKGPWVSSSSGEFDNAVRDCRAGKNPGNCGKKGGTGVKGGTGAIVTIRAAQVRGNLRCNVAGGAGGPGGSAGPSRMLWDQATTPGHRNDGCCSEGSGDPGLKGDPGRCQVETVTCSNGKSGT